MKTLKMFAKLCLALAVLALAGCSGAQSTPANGSASPVSGIWTGKAEFGGIEFAVNAQGTAITKITFNFSDWTCGPTTMSGGISIGQDSEWEGWPIDGGMFSIEDKRLVPV